MSLADLERSIARKLTTFPGLKKKIKYLRSLVFAIISPGRHLTEAVGHCRRYLINHPAFLVISTLHLIMVMVAYS